MIAGARLRMLRNRLLRQSSPGRLVLTFIGLGAALLGVFLFAWLPEAGLAVSLPRLASGAGLEAAIGTLSGIVLLGYLVLLAYGSLLFTISALLASDELQLLLPSPWPVAAVMAARTWLRSANLLLISVVVVLPLLVLAPLAMGRPAAGLVVLVVLAVYPVLPVALVGMIVLPLVRLVPPSRAREVIGALSVLLAIGFQVGNVLLNPAYGSRPRGHFGLPDLPITTAPWLPSGWGARAIAGALAGDWGSAGLWTTVLVVASFLALALSIAVMSRVYISGWISGAEASRGPRVRGAQVRGGRPSLLRQLGLPVEVAAVARRDWLLRRRDIVLLLRLLLPTLALGFVIIRTSMGGIARLHDGGPGPGPAMLAVLPAAIVVFTLGQSLGLSAVSIEGRSIWIYAVSPNSMGRLLLAKLVGAVPLQVALALVAGAVLEVIVAPGPGWALGALGALAVYSACLGAVTIAVGALWPNFTWSDPRRMISPAAAWLGIGAQLALTAVLALSVGVPVGLSYIAPVPRLPAFLVGAALMAAAGGGAAYAGFAAARARMERLDLSLDVGPGIE